MTEEGFNVQYSEDQANEQPQSPRVMVGPHQLGGIEVIARDAAGDTISTRIDIPEAAMLVAHLNALLTMAFQTIYAQQIQAAQQASKIYTPPGS